MTSHVDFREPRKGVKVLKVRYPGGDICYHENVFSWDVLPSGAVLINYDHDEEVAMKSLIPAGCRVDFYECTQDADSVNGMLGDD